MTTGMRRGELCGLRFARVDLDAEVIDLRRNWVLGAEKDTNTHQNRRIALSWSARSPASTYPPSLADSAMEEAAQRP